MPKETLTYKGAVYPWHMDHMDHMNVMFIVGKFDEATWNFFAGFGMDVAYFKDNRSGMAAVQQNIAYRKEAMPGAVVEVRTRIVELRDKVLKYVHTMTDGDGDIIAECEMTTVHMDTDARGSSPFPEAIRNALTKTL